MDKVHEAIDRLLEAYMKAGGDKDPQRAAQFKAACAHAHGVVDESIHYLTNVLPQEA